MTAIWIFWSLLMIVAIAAYVAVARWQKPSEDFVHLQKLASWREFERDHTAYIIRRLQEAERHRAQIARKKADCAQQSAHRRRG